MHMPSANPLRMPRHMAQVTPHCSNEIHLPTSKRSVVTCLPCINQPAPSVSRKGVFPQAQAVVSCFIEQSRAAWFLRDKHGSK